MPLVQILTVDIPVSASMVGMELIVVTILMTVPTLLVFMVLLVLTVSEAFTADVRLEKLDYFVISTMRAPQIHVMLMLFVILVQLMVHLHVHVLQDTKE